MAAIILSSSWPAAPTNGKPCSSSSAPGPSPTKHSPEEPLPRAKTAFLRSTCSAQRVQALTVSASTVRRVWRSSAARGEGRGGGGGGGAGAGRTGGDEGRGRGAGPG